MKDGAPGGPAHRARVAHRARGRMRLKIHGLRGNASGLERLKQSIAPMDGVRGVETNAATGSVVVHYDPMLHSKFHDRLAEQGSSTGAFHLELPKIGGGGELILNIEEEAAFLSDHSDTARKIVELFSGLDRAVKRATDNAVDLKVLLPLGLAVYSALEIGVEVSTPLWATLGIFSFNSFLALHSSPPVEGSGAQSRSAVLPDSGRNSAGKR